MPKQTKTHRTPWTARLVALAIPVLLGAGCGADSPVCAMVGSLHVTVVDSADNVVDDATLTVEATRDGEDAWEPCERIGDGAWDCGGGGTFDIRATLGARTGALADQTTPTMTCQMRFDATLTLSD